MKPLLALLACCLIAPSAAPRAPKNAAAVLAQPYAHFGFDMLRRLRAEQPHANVFISPASIAVALAIAGNGAAGATRSAILGALHAQNIPLDSFNAANQALARELADTASVQLAMANGLWLQEGFPVNPAFARTAREEYGAEVASLDFRSPAAVHTVNAWVRQHTKGRIDRLVESFDPATVLMIANAIAFKGKWTLPFAPAQTVQKPFTTANGTTVNVPMMSHTARYRYAESNGTRTIRLPYGDGNFAMYVVLPKSAAALDLLVHAMTAAKFDALAGSLVEREGTIELPRFTIDYSATLNTALRELGMGVAFTGNADFDNIHRRPPTIAISDVLHKSFLKVDEVGTQAAAVTGVEMRMTAVIAGPPPFHMIVDRPFLLAIRDDRSGQLLFLGTIARP